MALSCVDDTNTMAMSTTAVFTVDVCHFFVIVSYWLQRVIFAGKRVISRCSVVSGIQLWLRSIRTWGVLQIGG